MFSAMTFDYQNPDTKKRRQCSKCGAFLGPAATYCSRCGQTAVGGGVKFVKWLIILVLIIVAVGYFRASDFHPVEWVETKLDDLLESSEKPRSGKTASRHYQTATPKTGSRSGQTAAPTRNCKTSSRRP
jgi:ribosomal protein S27AE